MALLDTVELFSFPRFAGTDGEKRAARQLEDAFRDLGLETCRESFRAGLNAVTTYRARVHSLAALGTLGLGLFLPDRPLGALVVGGVLLVLIANAGRWPRFIEPAFDGDPSVESANVIGRRPGRGATIVCLAHHDTKSSALPTFFPVALILLGVASIAILSIAAGLALFAGFSLSQVFASTIAWVGACGFLASLRNPSGNTSPGAMDNASGLAVLLELARMLPDDPALVGAELVFVSTGAEELGLVGALRWIQAHGGALDAGRTAFINVDSVGVGRGLLAVDVRGELPMKSILRGASREAGIDTRLVSFLPGVGVDTMPIGARGFSTVTILGRVFGRASRRFHSPRDTIEHLNEAGLQDAATLAAAIARQVVGTIRS